MSGKITQRDLVLEYFRDHPDEDVEHPQIVDWVVSEYKERTGRVFRDPDRQIRNLYSDGFLVKIKKGVYRYDPQSKKPLKDFTPKQKEEIMRLGKYRCATCGGGKCEGLELHIDHMRPRDKGGESVIENGQILCSAHNFKKKNYSQTETGKRMFMNLHKLAAKKNDEELRAFCKDVLGVFKKHGINGHIVWDDPKNSDHA